MSYVARRSYAQARGGRSSKGSRRPVRLRWRMKACVVGGGVQSERRGPIVQPCGPW